MTKPTRTPTSKPTTPAKAPTKTRTKAAAVAPAVAKGMPPSKPAGAAQAAKSVAEKKSLAPVTRAPARAKPKPEVSPEQRRCYVEVAAYFIAERHGFTPGRDAEDWIAAEAEIDRMIAEGRLRTG